MHTKFYYSIKSEQREAHQSLAKTLAAMGGSPYTQDKFDQEPCPFLLFLDVRLSPGPLRFSNQASSVSIALLQNKKQAYRAYLEGFAHYLLLGASQKEYRMLIEKILAVIGRPTTHLSLNNKSEYWQLPWTKILFLKADRNYTDIYLTEGKVTAYHSLKYFERELPSSFVRVHRSYIIYIPKLKRVHFGKAFIQLWGWEGTLPISTGYLPGLRERLNCLQYPNP